MKRVVMLAVALAVLGTALTAEAGVFRCRKVKCEPVKVCSPAKAVKACAPAAPAKLAPVPAKTVAVKACAPATPVCKAVVKCKVKCRCVKAVRAKCVLKKVVKAVKSVKIRKCCR